MGELAKILNELSVKVKDSPRIGLELNDNVSRILRYMTDGVMTATDRRGSVPLVNERALQLLGIDQHLPSGISIASPLAPADQYTLTDLLGDDRETHGLGDHGSIPSSRENSPFAGVRLLQWGGLCLTDARTRERPSKNGGTLYPTSHTNWRTPLTSIKSYTEALREGAWQDEVMQPQFLNVIQLETKSKDG